MILAEWKLFVVTMKTHLEEEEVIALPLMQSYYTPQEIAKVTNAIIKRESKLIFLFSSLCVSFVE